MKDQEKIDALRKLLGTVVKNTKLAMEGKPAPAQTETNLTAKVLEQTLGRKPTAPEMIKVQMY